MWLFYIFCYFKRNYDVLNLPIYLPICLPTYLHTGRQTEKQTDRQTDRQTDKCKNNIHYNYILSCRKTSNVISFFKTSVRSWKKHQWKTSRLGKVTTRQRSACLWNFNPGKATFKHKSQKCDSFFICKRQIPFYWFTGLFYWQDKVRET